MTALAEAHIAGQQRIRTAAAAAVTTAWAGLAGYDEADVGTFTAAAAAVVLAAQRQSAMLTAGFLARELGRRSVPVDVAAVTGPAVRAGTEPVAVYRRPFVTVWSALADRRPYAEAVDAGRARAASSAATDVQLTMRATLRDVGRREPLIVGYQRVPNSGACAFCRRVAGQRYLAADLMPVHPGCGCGVDVITQANRAQFRGNLDNDLAPAGAGDGLEVAVREHGELGPVLVNPAHVFSAPDDRASSAGAAGAAGGSGGGPRRPTNPPAPPGDDPPEEVSGDEFHRAFQKPLGGPRAAWLTAYTPGEFRAMRCFLANGGATGAAIKTAADGRLEAVSVFNAGGPRGAGSRMLDHVVTLGATRLDCIGDDLRAVYERKGFRVTETIEWDDAYAPDGWDYDVDGRPKLYVMELDR